MNHECPVCGGVDTIVTRSMSNTLYKHCTVQGCNWEYTTQSVNDYSWVTPAIERRIVKFIVEDFTTEELLAIPGVYIAVVNTVNAEVIDHYSDRLPVPEIGSEEE